MYGATESLPPHMILHYLECFDSFRAVSYAMIATMTIVMQTTTHRYTTARPLSLMCDLDVDTNVSFTIYDWASMLKVAQTDSIQSIR